MATPATPDAPFGEEYGFYLSGAFGPVPDERVLQDFEVEGTIPADLNGVYLRNGPNPRFAPAGRYHAFDGDGMIHSAHFANGKVTYRNRWVQTEGLQEELSAGQATHRGIMDTRKGRDDNPLKNTANTDVVGHAGHAVVSWYQAGIPYLLDPVTLETRGQAPYKGLGNGMSAHSKVDPETDEMMFFDYWSESPYMSYGVVGADGQLCHEVPIQLPGSRMPHDMAISKHYSILHDLPLVHCPEALRHGRHKIKFDPSLPTRLGVIPRYGKADEVRWFDFSPCFIYHTINAWEEGDELVMVGCRYMPCEGPDGQIDAETTAADIAQLRMHARLWIWRMNLVTGATHESVLNAEHNVEFPSMNLAFQGRRNRWAYLVDHNPDVLHWMGIRKFDLDTGACVGAFSDDPVNAWYSEPWFAPRVGSAEEDDGYLVVFCINVATGRSELQIFDARALDNGPLARVIIPVKVPAGFHATWINGDRLN
ncbi:carotenoid oxygenase family protein [Pseudomonas sp. Marseille-Q8238]